MQSQEDVTQTSQTQTSSSLANDASKIAYAMKSELDKYVVGNDDVKTAVIIGFLTGFPTLLIGDPGTAKTYTIELASRMVDGIKPEELFVVLAHEAMVPEDIFGNINLKKLREEGIPEYITEGFLPSAKVVFIDEIFKANKVLAESLFRAINEKKFRNGTKEVSLPWLAFFSASNEVRVNTQADRAFLDRFRIFATTLSPNIENTTELKKIAERYYSVLVAKKPQSIPKITSYDTLKDIQEKIADYEKYVNQDLILEAVKQANIILNAIAQGIQQRAFSDPSIIRNYFKSMGGYLTLSERKFKSIIQVANAIRGILGNNTLTPAHVALAFYLTIPFTPELRNIITPVIQSLLNNYIEQEASIQQSNSNKNNFEIDLEKYIDEIRGVSKTFGIQELNNVIDNATTYVVDVLSKSFVANTPELAKEKASLISAFTSFVDETNTLNKLTKFENAVKKLTEIYNTTNNVKTKIFLQKLLQYISPQVSQYLAKLNINEIAKQFESKLDEAYTKAVKDVEKQFNKIFRELKNKDLTELKKLIDGIKTFFPQFASNLPEISIIINKQELEKEKEKILQTLNEVYNSEKANIQMFINALKSRKEG